MPIGGGTFTLQNKVLPGVYMNFVSASGGVSAGSRGIASIPAELGWGAEDTIIKMDSGDFNRQAVTVFGYDATAPELLLIREAFKRAKTLLVYRVDSGGSKATKEIGGITVTARYSGNRGNALKVAVLENTDESFDVVTAPSEVTTRTAFTRFERSSVSTPKSVQLALYPAAGEPSVISPKSRSKSLISIHLLP